MLVLPECAGDFATNEGRKLHFCHLFHNLAAKGEVRSAGKALLGCNLGQQGTVGRWRSLSRGSSSCAWLGQGIRIRDGEVRYRRWLFCGRCDGVVIALNKESYAECIKNRQQLVEPNTRGVSQLERCEQALRNTGFFSECRTGDSLRLSCLTHIDASLARCGDGKDIHGDLQHADFCISV